MTTKKPIYEHYHPDEHRFVDQVHDWLDFVSRKHLTKQTDFLDPRQATILTSMMNRHTEVHGKLDGGYPSAERVRAILAPTYQSLDELDFAIHTIVAKLDATHASKLEHRDYLGAILGLGMKREKIGDIQLFEQGCYYLVTAEAAQYLHLHLSQIHKYHVQTEILLASERQWGSPKYEEMFISVASMRLDGIVSDVYRMSRAQVLHPIQAKRCRVNWKVTEDPSYPLRKDDLISLQGYGRFKVMDVEGISKKGRIRIKIGKLI